eukprot:scaffold2968_cov111-Isochrysis_galbana.AAC.3
MIGRAPGETVKGGEEKGGNASLPGDSCCSAPSPELKPSPRTWRPEEGDGMGEEWEGGGGVSGRQGTEGVPPSRR